MTILWRTEPPRTPPRAGELRRSLAAGLDCYLSLLTGGLVARPHIETAGGPEAAGLLLGPALAFSFLNQVMLTALVGAGAGKLIMDIRVVSLPGAGRPGPGTLTRRWLYGLGRVPLQPWYWLHPYRSGTDVGRHPAGGGTSGCPHADRFADPSGVRQVRRGDLAAYRTSGAGQQRRR
ncbi:RDD family protein [Streptomyces sp. LN785]|uniref:RDD family protein n=1 Tax=Streptomyces sp. LN785 TaxID=3112983 RepID=UPI003717CFE3